LLRERIKRLLLDPANDTTVQLFTEACVQILSVCKNLTYLDCSTYNDDCAQLSLCRLPTTACFSSTLLHLDIVLTSFDDCLYLLDGRLEQLTELILEIDEINASSLNIDNSVRKSFI
jgi:hypothetical protein